MTESVEVDTSESDLIESTPETDDRPAESGKHHRRPRKRGGREEHRTQRPNQNRARSDRSEIVQDQPAAESAMAFDAPREAHRDAEAVMSALPAQVTTAVSEPQSAAEEDTASRRWQPPTATLSEPPAQPKSGWWRRKSG